MDGRLLKLVTLLAAILAVTSQALSIVSTTTTTSLLFIGLSLVFILIGLASMSLEVVQSFYATITQQEVTLKLAPRGHRE